MTAIVEGLEVITDRDSQLLHAFVLPGANRTLVMRSGPVGLVLAHRAVTFDRRVERLDIPRVNEAVDDGAWNPRKITGGSGWSKHATGGAMDLNWQRHGYNVPTERTFTQIQINEIHRSNAKRYEGIVEWGGDWPSHPGSKAKPDAMHFQISSRLITPYGDCLELARKLARTQIGREILEANPGQQATLRKK